MTFKRSIVAAALGLSFLNVQAVMACELDGVTGNVSILANEFPAIQAVVAAASTCAGGELTIKSNLTKEHKEIQNAALTANPSEYTSAFVANGTLVTLMNEGLVRPLDDLIAEYGSSVPDSQKIVIDGKVMAIAFMANAQHLMYRTDVLAAAGVEVPGSYEEVLDAAQVIKDKGLMEYPLTGTFKTGWNLGEEFLNMYMGYGGDLFQTGSPEPNLQNEQAMNTLTTLKAMTEFMNPDYLTFDSTAASAEFEQGKAAIMNLWGSRATSVVDDEGAIEEIAGNVGFAAAPTVGGGETPATTLWWDGFTISKNISDEDAAATFQVLLNGITTEMANANGDAAVWLIDGYEPTLTDEGVLGSAKAGSRPYPMLPYVGLLHTALGDELVDFLQGDESAEEALADVESAYRTAAEAAGYL